MTVRDLTILGCSSQQPTRKHNHGAYLLRWNNEGLLFDPGEGTQRQFIFANVAPPVVTRIFISHFHGDHCLGLGSMLMRLNLDNVTHPIHCYYPASGKKYFDRLRYSTIYDERIDVVEHPVTEEGQVFDDGKFSIEARFLDHRVDNLGWRIKEADSRKFIKKELHKYGVKGSMVRELQEAGKLFIDGRFVFLDELSYLRKGDVFSVVIDSRPSKACVELARGAKILLCESTYLDCHAHLADKYYHMTAKQAALIAREAEVDQLLLTHFSARYCELEAFVEEAREIFLNVDYAEDFKVFPFVK